MRDLLKWTMYGAVFAVPFVLLIVSGSMFFPFITGKNFAFRVLVEIGFAAWLLLALIDRAYRPRLSYILYAILGLVGVMFAADLFGEYAPKSFWSNYERMEGWVTLLHFLMYFIILSAVLNTEKLWNWFLNTALAAAAVMSLYALGQAAGALDISQGGVWRVDGRLGNSSYLGVYMLFHIFIAAWLSLRAQAPLRRWLYGSLIALFVFILSQTGTRGAMYGLIGGSILTFLYLALMAPRGAAIKKVAAGGLLAVVLTATGVYLARDTALVQNSPALDRFAGITLSEGNVRFLVWQMAFEGVKERPILGWGQENFNYVFNKYYDPALYGAEQWYDRTHNIFLDWLIAGGVLGLLAYLSILAAALWYAAAAPVWGRFAAGARSAPAFTVPEQALIFGLLAAYMFHNLFVFDNLGSWIFYAVILALIHSRVAREWPAMESFSIDRGTWERVAVPAVVIVTGFAVYFINVPGILAARGIIDAYRSQTVEGRVAAFEQALARGSFARQEIVEQMAQTGGQMLSQPGASDEEKLRIKLAVEDALAGMIAEKPNDARLHLLLGGFYRAAGDYERSLQQYEIAESLSPRKQAIIGEKALLLMISGRQEEAIDNFRRAYELDRRNQAALVRLAAAALYSGDQDGFSALISEEELDKKEGLWKEFVSNQMLLQVAHQQKRYGLLEYILQGRIEQDPANSELRVNLAAMYFEQGDRAEAARVIERAMVDIPAFRADGEAILAGLREE